VRNAFRACHRDLFQFERPHHGIDDDGVQGQYANRYTDGELADDHAGVQFHLADDCGKIRTRTGGAPVASFRPADQVPGLALPGDTAGNALTRSTACLRSPSVSASVGAPMQRQFQGQFRQCPHPTR